MLAFHLRLVWTSVKASPQVAAISVAAIALGVAVTAAATTLYLLTIRDPLPDKSGQLFSVRLDSWERKTDPIAVEPGEPPLFLTYRDLQGVLASTIPVNQTGVGIASTFVFPPQGEEKPARAWVRLCHAGFFSMFNVPFRHGHGWSKEMDETRASVVVLSHEANRRWFNGDNSVGRSIRLGREEFRVVGILAPYKPVPLFYDVANTPMKGVRDFFVPFGHILARGSGLALEGHRHSWGELYTGEAFFLRGETCWAQFWVELPPERVEAYNDFLSDYALGQQRLGRFPRGVNHRLTPLTAWLRVGNPFAAQFYVAMLLSFLFLAACALNTTGLLLAKLLAKASRLGLQRALGASRSSVLFQYVLECELLGLTGGVIGIGLAVVCVRSIALVLGFDLGLGEFVGYAVGSSLAFALIAGLLAGAYPAWRASRTVPAVQLKIR